MKFRSVRFGLSFRQGECQAERVGARGLELDAAYSRAMDGMTRE